MEILTRFLIGGLIVSVFAVVGSVFKPASLSGLFGASPSVALASIALTAVKHGMRYTAIESRSMLVGAVAMAAAAWIACQLMMRRKVVALPATMCGLIVWFVVAFSLEALVFAK